MDVVQVGDKEGTVLGVEGREQAQRADDGERHLGIVAGRTDRQSQRIAHSQPLLRQETAAHQDAVRSHGQPVHQLAQRLVVGKIGPEKGYSRKVDPVDAQDLPRLLAAADVGRGAVIAHAGRGLDAGHIQVLADGQKEPERLVLPKFARSSSPGPAA